MQLYAELRTDEDVKSRKRIRNGKRSGKWAMIEGRRGNRV
jgi:hypothetical protein